MIIININEFFQFTLAQAFFYLLTTGLISVITSLIMSKLSMKNELEKHRKNILISNDEGEKEFLRKIINDNKIKILNSGRRLNRRITVLQLNKNENLLNVSNKYNLLTTIYLFLQFMKIINNVEKTTEQIDISKLNDYDYDFLQFVKIFKAFTCDAYFIKQIYNDYNVNTANNHLRTFDLEYVLTAFERFNNYYEFRNYFEIDNDKFIKEFNEVYYFFLDLEMVETQYKAQILQALQYTIICFTNTYGYITWKLSDNITKSLCYDTRTLKLLNNGFKYVVEKNKLSNQTELRKIIIYLEEVKRNVQSTDQVTFNNYYDPFDMM